jgi:hypothetical protein
VVLLAILAQTQNISRNITLGSADSRPDPEKLGPTPGPILEEMARYFHLLGIDILLNERCEPCVLELNDRPSMCVTYDIEHTLKTQLVRDALNLITVDGKPPPSDVPAGQWEKVFPDDTGTFGREAEDILTGASPWTTTAKTTVVKRLGYVPSVSKLRRPFRRSLGLPPLQQ